MRTFPELIAIEVPAPVYTKPHKLIDYNAQFTTIEFITMIRKIDEDIKTAMKDKDAIKLQVLRSLKSEIKNAEIRKGTLGNPLQESEILGLIRKQVKQREDSIAQFEKGNRLDLVEKEQGEKTILESYLPKPLSEAIINSLIDQAITLTGATTKKEMGKVIKLATELSGGRVDGKTLSTLISQKLN